jgi:hypothetical protein
MLKIISRIIVVPVLLIVAGLIYIDPYNLLYDQHWKYNYPKANKDLPWVRFLWDGTTINGRHYDKAAMLLPVTVEGIPASANFCCQFDLGAVFTMLYGNTLEPYLQYSPALKSKVDHNLWHKCMKNTGLQIGDIWIRSDQLLIYKHYGDAPSKDSLFSHQMKAIGTIGIDICQDKVLVIDYPNTRLCLLDSVPAEYRTHLCDMTVTASGRALLKMKHKGKEYDLFYDTGSSTFPLWVSKSMAADFSASLVDDTVVGSQWGNLLTVYGRRMTDTVTVGGKLFSNFELFNNNYFGSSLLTNLAIKALGFSALSGNGLFYNSIFIPDFKTKNSELYK